MKKSTKITLLVLCAPTIVACSQEEASVDIMQDRYKSAGDCNKDWKSTGECKSYSGGGYVGPTYFYNHSTSQPFAVYSDGTSRPIAREYGGNSPKTGTLTATRPMSSFSNPSGVLKSSAAASFSNRTATGTSRSGFGSSARGSSGG